MSLGTTYSSNVPWEGLQVTNFDQCLHIVLVIGKCADAFRRIFRLGGEVEGRGLCGGSFHGGICYGEENFHEGGAGFLSVFFKEEE